MARAGQEMAQVTFDDRPVLRGPTLTVRPLVEADRAGLTAAASDPETWAGHPAKDRCKPEVFDGYFDLLLKLGGAVAIVDHATDAIIGCSRFYAVPDQPGDIGVGFTFLRHTFWGGQTNFELKTLMLDHAFAQVAAVWFHIAPSNIRSQKATAKLGAEYAYTAMLDLAGTPAEWMCFRLGPQAWQAAKDRRAA